MGLYVCLPTRCLYRRIGEAVELCVLFYHKKTDHMIFFAKKKSADFFIGEAESKVQGGSSRKIIVAVNLKLLDYGFCQNSPSNKSEKI